MTSAAKRGRALAGLGKRALWRVALLPPVRGLRRATTARTQIGRPLQPVSRQFGWDRGQPVDRHYIDRFLSEHAADITGRVLEVGDDRYTRSFGRDVRRSDILDVDAGNRRATIVSDLAAGEGVPSEAFDCVVLTQTLLLIFDLHGAISQLHRALAPGGIVLATVPGISQACQNAGGDLWRFTEASARRLFAERFGENCVSVQAWGNLASACAFLEGRAAEELTPAELDSSDADYPVLIGVRAVKAG